MLFNSLEYLVFFIIVFTFYWKFNNIKTQNWLILLASYFFYGWWDWRFLALLLSSSLVDFFAGIYISKSNNKLRRKSILIGSIVWNLSILFLFKYFNFFIDSFFELFYKKIPEFSIISIILPVGLSFYTFQTISYTIDVYRQRFKPTTDIIVFLGYVSFFPQLVAGPIERASFLIPQFFKTKKFLWKNGRDGLRQILWGVFKKVVIADNLAVAVNAYYENPENFQSLELFIGITLFYFQLYCDFSGYTDIALGSAKLLGFRLHQNFKLPHFSKTIPEFWRRWNITLGQWFRDYFYIPIARKFKDNYIFKQIVLFSTFVLIGLWHGADNTFVAFGLIHGTLMVLYNSYKKFFNVKTKSIWINNILSFSSVILCMLFVIISSCFFRAADFSEGVLILKRIFMLIPDDDFRSIIGFKILFVILLIATEIATKNLNHPLQNLEQKLPKFIRWFIYYGLVIAILRYAGPKINFVYFQF